MSEDTRLARLTRREWLVTWARTRLYSLSQCSTYIVGLFLAMSSML